ncbi:hypothetical protein B0H34DRAFT_356992 [Crassisporium funariophilum]|nr:hypothetical protein B0H34DRAFT_356992 [Crassisporium funariophilum]
MLPSPAVAKYKRKRLVASPRKRIVETLTTRSRITNLGVYLLVGLCAVSLLLNLRYWTFHQSVHQYSNRGHPGPLSLATTKRPSTRKGLNHLIIVPCHSIWKGTSSWSDEKDWILESYQKGAGRVHAFYEHITQSVEIAQKDPHSLLVFSGGQTRPRSTTTEAESYLRLAQSAGLFPEPKPDSLPFERATTENYALDSYQNLLFSIARFREFTGHFPSLVTVVGYEFKRPRFTELHREALRWPINKFTYVGVDPEHVDSSIVIQGEKQNGYIPYTLDKYGCHSMLLTKRRQRNPYSRFHPYYTSAPELAPLLDWCPGAAQGGEATLFEENLPWDHLKILRDS